jgi:hypothetical protein
MKFSGLCFAAAIVAGQAAAQELVCDWTAYKAQPGLTAIRVAGGVQVTWLGERGEELRAGFGASGGQPAVRELAARSGQGKWIELGRNLTPEFQVTSGKRRLSEQQMAPLRELGIAFTPDVVEREKWNAFWDAPLMVPGRTGTNMDLPRTAAEIRRAWAGFHSTACQIATDGARLIVTFDGVDLGIFQGRLAFTAYRGSNLLRQEVVAKTDEPSVAFKYIGGLKGFAVSAETRVVWRDPARAWQEYAFGGAANRDPVGIRARNRLAILEAGGGSLGVLPPSHKFFWAREIETNLGYDYYRKDSETSFAIGIRQPDREEGYKPLGVSDDVWNRRVGEVRGEVNNFALYNAPPGTWQHMPVYFYLSRTGSQATAESVLRYTHDDIYKEVPGFQVLVSHFHFHVNELLTDAGTMDQQPPWIGVFRALGIKIAILADFHGGSHPSDTGAIRLNEQKVYFEGCRRFSDKGFLLIPSEEPDANFGGHYMFTFPKPVYFTHLRKPKDPPAQPYAENIEPFGKVYHTTSSATELQLLRDEHGLVWQTHPRTKGSAGYPDATRTTDFFNDDHFLGASFQSLPVDLSEKRLCEARCLGLLDDMNNWSGPKFMIAEGDTYMKYPDDETYPQLDVNYVKLDRVPRFDEGWAPVLDAMRAGRYFVTSGEVLFRGWGIQGSGPQSFYDAEVEWTFPPEFAELVWGDGAGTHSELISLVGMAPLSSHHFHVPFNPAGKKWVRFAVWDSAGNGAFTQPVHFK